MEIPSFEPVLATIGLPDGCGIQPIRQEASSRRYYRLTFGSPESVASYLAGLKNGDDVTIPAYRNPEEWDSSRVVLCVTEPQKFSKSDFFVINEYLLNHGIPVPGIYGCLDSRGLIFQSDCGDQDLNDYLRQNSAQNLSALQDVINILSSLHRLPPISPVSERFFDYEKFSFEINFLYENFEAALRRFGIAYSIDTKLRSGIEELIVRLSSGQNAVFTHRDFHTRNVLHKSGHQPWTVIDFQDARMGHPCYDLASFIFDPYIGFDDATRGSIIEAYESAMGVKLEGRVLLEHAMQRLLKALGTYLHMTVVKRHMGYRESIPVTLALIREVSQQLGLVELMSGFCDAVGDSIYPALMDL